MGRPVPLMEIDTSEVAFSTMRGDVEDKDLTNTEEYNDTFQEALTNNVDIQVGISKRFMKNRYSRVYVYPGGPQYGVTGQQSSERRTVC